jgi:hypothetical protein
MQIEDGRILTDRAGLLRLLRGGDRASLSRGRSAVVTRGAQMNDSRSDRRGNEGSGLPEDLPGLGKPCSSEAASTCP